MDEKDKELQSLRRELLLLKAIRREGKWIWNPDRMELHCSVCGDSYHFEDPDTVMEFMDHAHFCMTCGARMVE